MQQQRGPPRQGGYFSGVAASLLPLQPYLVLLAVVLAFGTLLAAAWVRRRRRAAASWRPLCGAAGGTKPEQAPPADAIGSSSSSSSLSTAAAAGNPGADLPPGAHPATPDPLPAPLAAHAAAQAAAAAPQQAQPRRLVRAALPDGEHHVRYSDGSAYYGEWRGGRMQGRGVFLWPSGDRYEGEWRDGLESGTGTFVLADGSTYYGSWQGGQMHGKCVYRPAVQDGAGEQVVYFQRYNQGSLVQEQVLRVAEKDVRKKQQKKEGKKKAKQEAKQLKIQLQYRPPKPGEAVYKGHHSYDLMRELQLGLTFSIAQAGLAAESRELQEADFFEETTQHFPPGAETGSYKWKDYAPKVFQRLRQAFGIDNIDYLLSLTGEAALRMLGSPGKSGSVFFLSDDDRFLVKTVGKEEMRLLLKLIPRYYRHCQQNPATLLVRFYGVHRVTPLLGRRVRFIVMGNVLPSDLRLHRKYDLKGSTYGRTAGEACRAANPHCTLKDLDVDMQLILPARQYEAALSQVRRDLALLERLHVIDYSLLLGVHFTRWGNEGWHAPFTDWPTEPGDSAAAGGGGSGGGGGGEGWWAGSEGNSPPLTPGGGAGPGPGPVDGSTPASPIAAAAAGAGTGAADAAAAGQRQQQQPAPAGPADDAAPGQPAAPAAPAAGPASSPAPRRGPSAFANRCSSIDAASVLAALIESLDQQAAAAEAGEEAPESPFPAALLRSDTLGAASGPAGEREGAASGGGADGGEEPLPAALRHAAATLVQLANQSRVQARQSARAALQSAAAAAAADSPDGGGGDAACQPAIPDPAASLPRHGGGGGGGQQAQQAQQLVQQPHQTQQGSQAPQEAAAGQPPGGADAVAAAAAASPRPCAGLPPPSAVPVVALAERRDPGHWWLDRSACGLGGAVCLGGASCLTEGEERWVCHPPPPKQQGQVPGQAPQPQPQHEPCVVLSGGGGSKSLHEMTAAVLGRDDSAAATAVLKQQAAQLGRLPSRRGSGGEHESVGRAVAAVAVRRGSTGAVQCEPVLLYFGIIDFLQDYSARKHLERWWKASVHGGERVSVADPRRYSRRFLHTLQAVLLEAGSSNGASCGGGGGGQG